MKPATQLPAPRPGATFNVQRLPRTRRGYESSRLMLQIKTGPCDVILEVYRVERSDKKDGVGAAFDECYRKAQILSEAWHKAFPQEAK